MFQLRTNNRKAISVVMTTLIILVASVVLGTGVVLYGTSLFQTGGQTQSISSQGIKMWINGTNSTNVGWGAAAIRNNGDVLVSVNTIQIRGVSVPYGNWFVETTTNNSTQVANNFQALFISPGTDKTGYMRSNTTPSAGEGCASSAYSGAFGPIAISEKASPDSISQPSSGNDLCLVKQNGPVALTPGAQMIVYFRIPNGILTQVDTGSTVTANIYAGSVGAPSSVTVGTS